MSRGYFRHQEPRFTRRIDGHAFGNPFSLTISGRRGAYAISKARERLFGKQANCHWCGRLTRYLTPPDGILPDDAATVDHVVSMHHRNPELPCEVVLACFACNRLRNERELAEMTPDEKLKRCGDGRRKT